MFENMSAFWTLASGPIAFVLTIISVVLAWRSIELQRRLKTLTIQNVRISAEKLGKSVVRSGFTPDVLIVPDAKNALIAHFMNKSFSRMPSILIGFQIYKIDVGKKPERAGFVTISTARSYILLPEAIKNYVGQNALFIDSIQKSGSTVESIKEKLIEIGFEQSQFKSCCLVRSTGFLHAPKPDYSHREAIGRVIFPWGEVEA